MSDDVPTRPNALGDDDDEGVYPPLPERGRLGEEGQLGGTDGLGGAGGTGGRGGRGGIGDKGDIGPRGQRGPVGPSGGVPGEDGGQGPKGEPGEVTDVQTRFSKIALFIVVLLTALSSMFFAIQASNRLDDIEAARSALMTQQQALTSQAKCEFDLLEEMLGALQVRSGFTQAAAETTLAGDQAQRAYLRALLGDTSDAESAQLTVAYLQALETKIDATREQLVVRKLNPYPTDAELIACEEVE